MEGVLLGNKRRVGPLPMKSIDSLLRGIETFRTKVRINPYIFAFLSLGVGLFLQYLLNAATHQTTYLLLVISLFFAAWYGGLFPCVVISVAGFLIADYYFIPPVHSTFFPDPREYVRAAIFVTEGILFGLVGESRKRREEELKRVYEAEQKARLEAEESNHIRDDFISMASHELKSPITSQKLYIQALKDQMETKSDTTLQHFLNLINSQTDKMTNLINDLLNIAKIRAGKLSMNYTTFSLAECVKGVVEEVQAGETTHTIILKGKSSRSVYADRERIVQVLTNFLSNAIKYSPRAKKVLVTMEENSRNVSVSVKDFGIGINKADQKKLFTKYFRAEGTNEQTYQGFGMGLFIVAEIMKQHKGKIRVKSVKGKGSTFSFSLPLAKQ